jgi:K+-transporting ATPase ATPase C chain
MTIITGVIYPFMITGIAGLFIADKAGGSLIYRNGICVGSSLIGQNFTGDRYFWPRPSAVDYNPLPSGGSNLGPTSAALKQIIADRRKHLSLTNHSSLDIPADLLCASASGLDPHISPAAAHFQAERIIKARDIDPTAKTSFLSMIDKYTESPAFNIWGEPRVNVLKLNLALDSLTGVQK